MPADSDRRADGPPTSGDRELVDSTPHVCECGERFASWTLYLEHEPACAQRAWYRVVYQVEVCSELPFDPGHNYPELDDLAAIQAAAVAQGATVTVRAQVHELTFKLITNTPWPPAAIEKIAAEFNRRYEGKFAVDSAYLAEARLVDRPADP